MGRIAVVIAVVVLAVFVAGCEFETVNTEAIQESAVEYFSQYTDKSVDWVVCGVYLLTVAIETPSDVRMFQDDEEYRKFVLGGIVEICDERFPQS